MIQAKYRLLLASFLTISSLITTAHDKSFQHNIQLQLSDSNGWPVAGTKFWVTLTITKDDSLVTVEWPLINFPTGQVSTDDPYYPSGQVIPGFPPLGGYLYTSDGFLPKDYRPVDLVPRAIVAASNNGMSPVFSFTQDPNTLPQPPAGYIVQMTNAGAFVVQAAGTFGNIIAPGPQVLMPGSITYSVKSTKRSHDDIQFDENTRSHDSAEFKHNTKISKGASNVTQFIGGALGDGYRDSHVNDAFNGKIAFTWTDNSTFTHLDNGTQDAMVAIGKVKDGKIKIKKIFNLTNFPDLPFTPTYHGLQAWDTAVTFNRTNPDNIVVSWGLIDRVSALPATISSLYRAVSFDGGKTWPINGLTNIQPTGTPPSFGDARGVASDKFGNIWYSASNRFDGSGNFINQAFFMVSTDGGVNYSVVYSIPVTTPAITDYPQYCFGTNSSGQYGLYFQATFSPNLLAGGIDAFPSVGFIPINGLGLFGSVEYVQLPGLAPALVTSDVTASNDGRFWLQGLNSGAVSTPYSFIQPLLIAYKSPSETLDINWSGAWDARVVNNIASTFADNGEVPPTFPQPISFQLYLLTSAQSIIYDESRQALYMLTNGQQPDFGQNMQIYFSISRNNGMTWSDPIRVNTSHTANRGIQSMALDPITGDLVFGWYDGRNDKTFKSVEYYGAILTAHELDKLVGDIPLSNPIFITPSVGPVGP